MNGTKSTFGQRNRAIQSQRIAGFSLIEMMIAMVLGLLLSAGIVTLFSGTSKTSRVQNGLANLQENGRYAMSRIENDLRKLGGQFRMNTSGQAFVQTSNGPVYPNIGPSMNVTGFTFPDGAGAAPTGWPAAKVYALSPRYFLQGYDCQTGTCSPTVPAGVAPAAGAGVGSRVTGTDVLTLRHQRGTGWSYSVTGSGTGTVITLLPKWTAPADCTQGGDDCLNIATNDLVLLSDCSGPTVFQVTKQSDGTLTPIGLRDVNQLKPSPGSDGCDPRVFNFSKDMVTVSYWLQLAADGNAAGRVIPVLMRRENSDVAQETVRGVERLDFLYGVQLKSGGMRYLTGGDTGSNAVGALSSSTNCTDQPAGLTALEAGCLWRSVRSIEVHALLNTVDNIDLSNIDMAYRYKTTTPAAPTGTTMPVTLLPVGRMMRREFVVLVSARNSNS